MDTSDLTLHLDMKLPEQVLQFDLKGAHVLDKWREIRLNFRSDTLSKSISAKNGGVVCFKPFRAADDTAVCCELYITLFANQCKQ